MSKGSGGNRKSSSSKPAAMSGSNISSKLSEARKFAREYPGSSGYPVYNVRFDAKTKTLSVEVKMVSSYTESYNGGKTVVNIDNGPAGTSKVFDTASAQGLKGLKSVSYDSVKPIREKFTDAVSSPAKPVRLIVKETYVSPEKWGVINEAQKKKANKYYKSDYLSLLF